MELESVVIKEMPCPSHLTMEFLECWATMSKPNVLKEPHHYLTIADLTKYGYGEILISDQSKNPTGTIKDYIAADVVNFYRTFALCIEPDTELTSMPVQRASEITAGNTGRSLAVALAASGMPPPKLLVDKGINPERLAELCKLDADIYATDLSKQRLTPEDVARLTHNQHPLNLQSIRRTCYKDHAMGMLKLLSPDEIYLPYGSGDLFESYLGVLQARANGLLSLLRKSPNVFGAKPQKSDSIADKLAGKFKPISLFSPEEIEELKKGEVLGNATGIYKVREGMIKKAHKIMNEFCPAEPSAAAGLALYLQRHKEGLVNPQERILVVNTGKGI